MTYNQYNALYYNTTFWALLILANCSETSWAVVTYLVGAAITFIVGVFAELKAVKEFNQGE